MENTYKSQAARDAQKFGYGDANYWAYLDASAESQAAYYLDRGDPQTAERILLRSLSDCLKGNNGD